MIELQFLRIMLGGRIDAVQKTEERGASAVEWVVITALLVGIALAVGVILLNKIRSKANSIDLG